MQEDESLRTAAEVAVALRISPRTLIDWRKRGTGPPWLRVGKAVLYPARDLQEWLARRARASAA